MKNTIKKGLFTIGCKLTGIDSEKEYQEILKLSNKDQLQSFIDQRLIDLLLHAYHHTRYYHRIFDEVNLIQNDHVDLSRFQDIPLLTKEVIRKYPQDLISDDYHKRNGYHNSSGGSTGEPVQLIQDRQYRIWSKATQYYYYNDILKIDEPIVKKIIVWGSDRDLFTGTIGAKAKISNWVTNTIMLNSFKMTLADIERYVDTINSYKPDLIRGYPGSLYEICRYAERKNLILFSPKVIVSAAETLNNEMRDQIERVFGKKVYNFYGSREVSNLAGECEKGLMHSFMFWNYQELLDSQNQPVNEGTEGKIIVSNLFNYSMPLIRYEIGDMAIRGPEYCSCGSVLPTFRQVTGRITEHFKLKNGTTIPAEFFIHLIGVVCNTGEIKKFQVIQEDFNLVRILVVSAGLSESYKRDIENKIKIVMGQDCQILWNFVEDIPLNSNGKYLYTKSLMWT